VNAKQPMCEKCGEIDTRIVRLKKMALSILQDKQTLAGIDTLVAQLEAEKIKLHPEQNK
jgi:hypothetical protein